MICANCGKSEIEAKGSMKFPLCEECFNNRFESDEDYLNWLKEKGF